MSLHKSSILDYKSTHQTLTIPDESFTSYMKEHVEPLLDKHRKIHKLYRLPNQLIYAESYMPKQPKGIVVISHGFTENAEKYLEAIYYFYQQDLGVYAIDHQGHGRSYRFNTTDYSLTHINNFEDYVENLDFLMQTEVIPNSNGLPLYLYCHSMGGAVGALYLEQHPTVFQKAVLSSPMLEINIGKAPRFSAVLLTDLMCLIGRSKKYMPTHHGFNPQPDFAGSCSSCPARYDYYFQKQLAHREFQNSGATNTWAKAAMHATAVLNEQKNCARVKTPVLLFQAELDDMVNPTGQDLFISQIPDGRILFVPGTKHEIYMAPADIQTKYWNAIFDFLLD